MTMQSAPSAQKASDKISGAGMDRKIVKPSTSLKKVKWASIIVVFIALIAYFQSTLNSGKAMKVDSQRIAISAVTSGIFEDFIPIRARVIPAKTVYLDAIEGGRVERILVEDGVTLNAGDLIVELSNASLQLSVLGNEARVAEQLNNMRSIELSLEQNRLQHKRNLVDINYQIKLLTRQVSREDELMKTGAVSKSTYADTADTLEWYKARLALTLESQASDKKLQESQLVFLKDTAMRLESNLAISRQNLANMNVRAPVNGKLSGFDFEVGQSIDKGERLGQIDTPDDFKLTALIDEFYLSRVDINQHATFENYQLTVSKIYPQVTNGQFEVDLQFVDQQPDGIRRGQTVQTKLTLGDSSEALLIPNGAFYQDTGGNWIFVVTADSNEAVRRPVRLGRRNSRFIEVLDGLEVGERVVTSPYTSYQNMQRLKLN
ncbi:efflux RND transporter periplasmic adaptor subunit [Psychrosphaera sp. B3R10]|uniref:efflux RND transporter periplasmic adaptor subunit n=1 Tax=unclassified Psychrosphaera TaxID=2641570 RepID=UPI001C092F36|nr:MULTISPECIES: efflux RND transporter periplasmic adaptor subunit [unclassified Psychrosphaera]MBU2883930.1 efflux RND transporter periplasmic adaptor subunit [Psychrosphaera sp. I2R16]MBU2990125.1 efflux RND transporter periplasmic adaptor subunit [Psychrosphaera sp. B3R10]